MSAEGEVRKTSKGFYEALNRMANGERGVMTPFWSHSKAATALHPIGGRTTGWEDILKSFDGVAKAATAGKVRLDDQMLHVEGGLAYETGVERGEITMAGQTVPIEARVTNVYRREGDGWKMVHHHADLSPAMLEVVAGMKG
jgi:ketosteroid isomerase-like protein